MKPSWWPALLPAVLLVGEQAAAVVNTCLDPTSDNYKCSGTTLNFHSCGLSDADFGHLDECMTAAGRSEIIELYLSDNGLNQVPADLFRGLTEAEVLDLSDNKLTSLPAGLFEGLGDLEYLILRGNQLEAMPQGPFDDLTGLTYLDLQGALSSDRLHSLPAGIFDELAILDTLDLSHNNFISLPADLFIKLFKLQFLDLAYNPKLQCFPLAELPDIDTDVNADDHLLSPEKPGPCGCPVDACEACQPGAFGYTCPLDNKR